MTTQIYLPDKHALAYYREQATAEFWDRHWQTERLQAIVRGTIDDGLFISAVKRHLPAGAVVLEGGCGMGTLVHALQYQGYTAIGIDFAEQTIQRIQAAVPELDVRVGDVRALQLPDASLDGYVSVGVIEHFWDGYAAIFQEMRRTLKIGGFLFVSFPFLSPLRRLKIALGMYAAQSSAALQEKQERFYQFALDPRKVCADLEAQGFEQVEQRGYDGIKGFKDEISLLQPALQPIYDGKRGQRWRSALNRLFLPFSAHMQLLVMRKR